MEGDCTENSISKSFAWKLLERFGVQGIQFVLQIILARILSPDHYGTLALMVIFTSLANVFIQSGFNTALIQNKDVTDEDYSSVFWVSLGITVILYSAIFLCAPAIAVFYEMPDLVAPLRVLALTLFPGTLNSIQLAKVSREMNFRKVFFSSILGVATSGLLGILLAYLGGGLWALVFQSLTNVTVSGIVMLCTVQWRPMLVCNWKRIKVLFAFGWKYLASGLLDTLSGDLWGLVVGKKFNSETLGFYDRGNQFPDFLISSIMGAMQSVMLPAMSAKQDHVSEVKHLMKNSLTLTTYIIFPMMAGLAGVATPVVQVLLSDKWLPCVPYLQIACFCMACYPMYIPNLQAISALGYSDVFLKLEIVKKIHSFMWLLYAIFFVRDPIQIALIDVACCVVALFINSYPNKKLVGYPIFEQLWDVFPAACASVIMLAVVLMVGKLSFAPIVILVLQIVTGVAVYLLISVTAKLKAFGMAWDILMGFWWKLVNARE